jgi:hypothetical protein
MKASIAHKVRPSSLILGKDSKKPWGRWDITFAKAYQRFLNEICQQCGYPKYICHTDDNRVQFHTRKDECAATAKAEREQERLTKDGKRVYGVKVYAEPYLTDEAVAEGLELSDFRRPYLLERAKKLGLVPENMEL